MSSGDEVDAPRDEGANEGNSVMAAASSSGEADELIGEVAGSVVNETGDVMAMASSGGEASEPMGEATVGNDKSKKTKRGKRAGRTGGDREVAERRRQGVKSGEQLPSG